MAATDAVEELEVAVDGLAGAGEAEGDAGVGAVLELHLVEEEGGVAGGALGAGDRGAGHRRDEDLGLDAGDGDVGGNGGLRGEHAAGSEGDVGVEADALLERAHLVDDAVQIDGVDRAAARER